MTDKEKNILYQSVGNQIKIFRNKSGFSQKFLADSLKLSRASIVNIEKGRQHASLHLLVDLSRIFNISITEFLAVYSSDENAIISNFSKIEKEIIRTTKGKDSIKVSKFLKELAS